MLTSCIAATLSDNWCFYWKANSVRFRFFKHSWIPLSLLPTLLFLRGFRPFDSNRIPDSSSGLPQPQPPSEPLTSGFVLPIFHYTYLRTVCITPLKKNQAASIEYIFIPEFAFPRPAPANLVLARPFSPRPYSSSRFFRLGSSFRYEKTNQA